MSLRSKIDLPEGVDPRDTILPSKLANEVRDDISSNHQVQMIWRLNRNDAEIAAEVLSMDDVIKSI